MVCFMCDLFCIIYNLLVGVLGEKATLNKSQIKVLYIHLYSDLYCR